VPPPLGEPHGPARPGPMYGPTRAPPPLGAPHGPFLPLPRLGRPRLGTTSYADSMRTVRLKRTGAGRGFAFDGPDVEHMHVHAAPVRLKRSTAAKAVDATEFRFKLTDQGARAWREAILPQGDAANRRSGWSGEFAESLERRKAVWKDAGWTVKKGVRVPDPGIAAQLDGLAEVNLGKATEVRNKGGTKLSWARDDGQQVRWTGKVDGRNVTIEYSDVAANDRTATAIHNEVRVWVEGEVPDEDYFANLMERFRFVRSVGVPTDAEVTAYAERALVSKLGTADARRAVYGRAGGQVGYDPGRVSTVTKLDPHQAEDAITNALADIRLRFGIGPSDLALGTTADGRTVVQLTDAAVQRLVDETGVTFFRHDLHHSISSDPALLVDMLSGDQGGLLSSRRRMADGLPFGGMSADRDYETGGADFVFTRQQNAPSWGSGRASSGSLIIDNDRLRDLDWFAYRNDLYGQTHVGSHYGRADFVEELREGANRAGGGSYGQETMFKDTIDFGHVQALYLDRYTYQQVLDGLAAKGVTRIGGRPVAEVVRLAGGQEPDLLPVFTPGGAHQPRRVDPGTPPTGAPPLSAMADPAGAIDPALEKQLVATMVKSAGGPWQAVSLAEQGMISADKAALWNAATKASIAEKYSLGPYPGDFVSAITDYGWDMADNDEIGAVLIKELADELLDPADAAVIKEWKF